MWVMEGGHCDDAQPSMAQHMAAASAVDADQSSLHQHTSPACVRPAAAAGRAWETVVVSWVDEC